MAFFSALSPCLIGMEACATAHYWGRVVLKQCWPNLQSLRKRRGRSERNPLPGTKRNPHRAADTCEAGDSCSDAQYPIRRTCICEVFSGKPLGGRDARGSQGNCAPLSLGHTALLTTKKKSLPGRPGRPLHSFDGAQSHMVIANRARSGEIQRGHVVCCHRVGPVIKRALPNYRVPAGSGRGPFAAATSAAVGLFGVSAASAIPANGVAISEAAAATQATQQVWWRYRWHRYHYWRRW
jgi:hypothetical protein